MAESREERLARIQAVLEDANANFVIYDDGRYRSLPLDDFHWLLSQVSGEREYRVEVMALGSSGEPRSNWVQLAATPSYSSMPDAVELARQENALQGDDPDFEYRVASAPVQVWTVEEETP